MWEFVMEVFMRRRPSIWQTTRRVCFGCFRIRENRHFSEQQYNLPGKLDSGEYWRRRCWECLRRFYHPRLSDAEARARFHRQVLCGECRCLRYVDEDCHGCVVKSDQIAEEARRKRQREEKREEAERIWDNDSVVPSWLDQEDTAAEPHQAAVTEAEGMWDSDSMVPSWFFQEDTSATEVGQAAVAGRNRLLTWIALVLKLKGRIRRSRAGGSSSPHPDVDGSGQDGAIAGPSSAPIALAV
ncbi:hypothetical protein B0I37DRAFT_382576 [Chaetomium sp. MPI-CAGE-AT-0009]|nr:hypothetical protein B0I37DRAFT_382576 [Chaetomium sp. MPI-CAGE-AT-0009]